MKARFVPVGIDSVPTVTSGGRATVVDIVERWEVFCGGELRVDGSEELCFDTLGGQSALRVRGWATTPPLSPTPFSHAQLPVRRGV